MHFFTWSVHCCWLLTSREKQKFTICTFTYTNILICPIYMVKTKFARSVASNIKNIIGIKLLSAHKVPKDTLAVYRKL